MRVLEVFRDGPAPMISAVCRDIGLTQTIDEMVAWDNRQCTLSPGLRVVPHDDSSSPPPMKMGVVV